MLGRVAVAVVVTAVLVWSAATVRADAQMRELRNAYYGDISSFCFAAEKSMVLRQGFVYPRGICDGFWKYGPSNMDDWMKLP